MSYLDRKWQYEIELLDGLNNYNNTDELINRIIVFFKLSRLTISRTSNNTVIAKVPYFYKDYNTGYRGVNNITILVTKDQDKYKIYVVIKMINMHIVVFFFSFLFSLLSSYPLSSCNIIDFTLSLLGMASVWSIILYFLAKACLKRIVYRLYNYIRTTNLHV